MKIYQVKDKFFISQDLAYSYLHRCCGKGVLIRTHEIIETPLPRKIPMRLIYNYDALLDIMYFDYKQSLHLIVPYGDPGGKFNPGRVHLENLAKTSGNIGLVHACVDLEVNSVREISSDGKVAIRGSILSDTLISGTIRKNSRILLDTGEDHMVAKL